MKNAKKIVAILLMGLSIGAIIPRQANAEWKKDKKGWWYTEGNSYLKNSWKNINGKWYYFDSNGYMVSNTTIDGYNINKDGVWDGKSNTSSSSSYTNTTSSKASSAKLNATKDFSWFEDNGKKYFKATSYNYFSNETVDYPCTTGLWNIDGLEYYFDSNGVMCTGTTNINGTNYIIDNNGMLLGSEMDERVTLMSTSAISTKGNTDNMSVKLKCDFTDEDSYQSVNGNTVTLLDRSKYPGSFAQIYGKIKAIDTKNESSKNNMVINATSSDTSVADINTSCQNTTNDIYLTAIPYKAGKTIITVNVNGTKISFDLIIE